MLQGSFKYGGQDYDLLPSPEGSSAEGCGKLVQLVLKQNEPCGAEQVSLRHAALFCAVLCCAVQTQCSFAGAWGGGHAPKAFYVSSYFWDRAVEAGKLTFLPTLLVIFLLVFNSTAMRGHSMGGIAGVLQGLLACRHDNDTHH